MEISDTTNTADTAIIRQLALPHPMDTSVAILGCISKLIEMLARCHADFA